MSNPSIGVTDGYDGAASAVVVRAVAAHRGVEPTALPPLYEWVDPDALDALFAPTGRGVRRRGGVEFTYDGSAIAVSIDDGIDVEIDGESVSEPDRSMIGADSGAGARSDS
ncbi:HalOD1 output domain-containing protein [Natrialbaceae archaeon GCM10025810]|uniref:HalOD1 output domain-containing protein n=1 Tax=Halovalidus salilacus TaxID=3075124 RepID=UPI00361B1087